MKCFFFLRDGSGAFAGSLGILFCETDAAGPYASALAHALPGYGQGLFVIVTDQSGHELARAPVDAGSRGRAPALELKLALASSGTAP
jgi:hypothetical protein